MNREIKFRAWDKQNNIMTTVWAINYQGFSNDVITSCFAVNPVTNGEYVLKAANADLMQYTGLKDKAGKEIFEGDIIADADLSYVVLFGEFQFEECDFVGFYLKETPLYCREHNIAGTGGPIGSVDQSVISVLGNIHQNLELLLKPESQC